MDRVSLRGELLSSVETLLSGCGFYVAHLRVALARHRARRLDLSPPTLAAQWDATFCFDIQRSSWGDVQDETGAGVLYNGLFVRELR